MCPMEKIVSCQISFIPVNSDDYIEDINKVLSIIKDYQLEYYIGMLSTTIRGNKNMVFDLIKQIYETMDSICSFTMDIKLSNVCGCTQKNS